MEKYMDGEVTDMENQDKEANQMTLFYIQQNEKVSNIIQISSGAEYIVMLDAEGKYGEQDIMEMDNQEQETQHYKHCHNK